MAEQVYRGNCHCGDNRFELTVPPITTATACTCLACKKGGYLWLVPPADTFREVRNAGELIEFESPALVHKFCAKCASTVTGEHTSGPMKGQFAVNVRVIQGVNPYKIDISTVTMEREKRELSPLPVGEPPAKHTGSCICGKVRTELLVPVAETEIKEDNCSTCVRIANVGTYPNRSQVRIHGLGHCIYYIRPPYNGGPAHCGTCGQFMFSKLNGPPVSMFFNLPPERLPVIIDRYAANMNLQPLNLRALDDVEISDIKYSPEDEGTDGYVLDPEWES